MNEHPLKNIANNVQKLRTQKQLTREQLSLILGFENSYISKPEKQKINITIEKLFKISQYFEVNITELLK